MSYGAYPLEGFLDRLAGPGGAPGGGAACAVAGALACALAELVLEHAARNATSGKEPAVGLRAASGEARELRARLLGLADDDSAAYARFAKMHRRGAGEPALRASYAACEVPLDIARSCVAALRLLARAREHAAPALRCDAEAGALLALAGARGACGLVDANLPAVGDRSLAEVLTREAAALRGQAEALARRAAPW